MNELTRGGLGIVIFLLPCVLVASGYVEFTNGAAFWKAFGALLGVRLFFATIDGLGGIVAWRLHGKKFAADKIFRWLRTNNFPTRYYRHDDFTNYLGRVEDDEACPTAVKRAAKEMYAMLGIVEDMGILAGARIHSASEIALEKYSPRANASEFRS